MNMGKRMTRVVLELNPHKYVLTSDTPVEAIIVDHRQPGKPNRVLLHAEVRPEIVEVEYRERCPGCRHWNAHYVCQRVDEE